VDEINRMVNTQSEVKIEAIRMGVPDAVYHRGTIPLGPNLEWNELK
jgi:hypothetical protein